MRFPPVKADRALLWLLLTPDAGVSERAAALLAVLKSCRLHPLDTTANAQVVIVDAEAVRARMADLLAVLGPDDVLHLVSSQNDRLTLEVIGGSAVSGEAPQERASSHQPPWLGG